MTIVTGSTAYSIVVRRMQEFKTALLAREAAQTAEMTTAWLEIERSLTQSINDLVAEIDLLISIGEIPSRNRFYRLQRLWDLLEQARIQSALFATDFVAPFITAGQEELAQWGIANAAELLEISFTNANIAAVFNRINIAAVEFMVGITGAGGPLGELLLKRIIPGPDVVRRVIDTLIEAVTRGYGPLRTARLIADDLAGGLNKALQIARTEQLRVYRESSLLQYLESGVVRGYKRLAGRDNRVCPACIMADGRFYELGVPFAEHVQGRCVPVPCVMGVENPQWETGMEWFKRQAPQIKVLILGPGRYEAWKAGEFELEDLITQTTHPIWGDALVPTPLKNLVSE